MHAAGHKGHLRREARARRTSMRAPDRAIASARIVAAVESLPEWQAAAVVAVYEPTGSEVDVSALAASALADGRTVLVPEVVDPKAGLMRFVPIEGSDADGSSDPDLIVVPLLAFDRAGRRLGQGGGFYDRWLAGSAALRVGVAFTCQEVPEVPVDAHDELLDVVVTDESVLRPGRTA